MGCEFRYFICPLSKIVINEHDYYDKYKLKFASFSLLYCSFRCHFLTKGNKTLICDENKENLKERREYIKQRTEITKYIVLIPKETICFNTIKNTLKLVEIL